MDIKQVETQRHRGHRAGVLPPRALRASVFPLPVRTSLNSGRYVGVADKAPDDFIFAERLEELNEELEVLNSEARELEERIAANVAKLLEAAT